MTQNYKHFFSEDDEREYWGREAAGCIFISKDTGRILLAFRGPEANEGGTWGTWGGKLDAYEDPKEAVQREIEEETGYNGDYKLSHLYTFADNDFQYHNYVVLVPFEFTPSLNWENEDSSWVEYGDWPQPMHFGLKALIQHAGHKIKRITSLIKSKTEKKKLFEFWQKRPSFCLKKSLLIKENLNNAVISKQGLIDDGIYGYEMKSPYTYIRYGYEPAAKLFYLYNIGTPNLADQNKGHARDLLDSFFQLIKQYGGALDTGSYTTSGMAYIKHVVERLSKKYNVRLVTGRYE